MLVEDWNSEWHLRLISYKRTGPSVNYLQFVHIVRATNTESIPQTETTWQPTSMRVMVGVKQSFLRCCGMFKAELTTNLFNTVHLLYLAVALDRHNGCHSLGQKSIISFPKKLHACIVGHLRNLCTRFHAKFHANWRWLDLAIVFEVF